MAQLCEGVSLNSTSLAAITQRGLDLYFEVYGWDVVARAVPRISATDYIEREKVGKFRHEFLGGVVYEMAANSQRHDAIVANIVASLAPAVPTSSRVHATDVRVHIESSEKEQFYYPDIVVTNSDLDRDDNLIKRPSLIFEVDVASN